MAVVANGAWSVRRSARSQALAALRSASLSRGSSLDIAIGVVFFLAALTLSLTHPWSHAFVGEAQNGDAAYWDFAGENWARGYAATKVPDIRPGYSVFLGIVYSLVGPDFTHAFVAQALMFAASVLLVYVLGARLAGRLAGLIAATMLALDPYIWEWTAITTTEIVGMTANLAALFFLIDAIRPGHRRWISAALFGVFLSYANIVRPVTLPYLGLALPIIAFLPRAPWTARLLRASVALAAALLTLAPGIAYQYISTGDPNLSSDGAGALFAASSPKYQVWTSAMVADISAQLTARGVAPTVQNLNAEFSRLTIQNYADYPIFQLQRTVRGMANYLSFEGETERPDQYAFTRPYVLSAFAVGAGLLVLTSPSRRKYWWLLSPAAIMAALLRWPLVALPVGQALGVVLPAARVVRMRRWRAIGLLLIAAYWLSAGFLLATSGGAEGFLLNRLYTQVEPARALLLAIVFTHVTLAHGAPRFRVARILSLEILIRHMPRLPGLTRSIIGVGATTVALVVGVGIARLIAVNVIPAEDPGAFVPPTSSQLSALATTLGLPNAIEYVTADSFVDVRSTLVSGDLPRKAIAYAIPGQFTRFLWYIADQDRTRYWFDFSDRIRPPTLDRDQLLAESLGHLRVSEYGDRVGLLIVVPTGAYFANTGDWSQLNLLTTRAFVPWDPASRGFQFTATSIFPLNTPLYDHKRFEAAQRVGGVTETGSIRVSSGGPLLPALSFKPSAAGTDQEQHASISFGDLLISPGGQFQAWVSLYPTLFGSAEIRPLRVQLFATSGELTSLVAERTIDPMDQSEWMFEPLTANLGDYENQHIDLTIRVVGLKSATTSEVLIGEPRVVMR